MELNAFPTLISPPTDPSAKLAQLPHPSPLLDPNALKVLLIEENESIKQHYCGSNQRKPRTMCSSESTIELNRKDNEEAKGNIQENGHVHSWTSVDSHRWTCSGQTQFVCGCSLT